MAQKIIVLVEDSAADARVVTRAIDKLGDATIEIIHHETAENALKYFQGCEHNADKRIVLMDINLPGTNGLTFLKHLKSTPSLKHIPVIIWTTSDQQQDIDNSYENGAGRLSLLVQAGDDRLRAGVPHNHGMTGFWCANLSVVL